MGIIDVEQTVASEALRFIKKDRSKLKLVLGLYALSIKNKEMGRTTRASYFFARHLDDLLDGEMEGIARPLEYTAVLRDEIINNEFDQSRKISRLAQFALSAVERKAKPTDSPRAEFVGLIDAMVFDYDRRQERRALDTKELESYYRSALNPALNIMFMSFGSDIRTSDIPDYAPNVGRLYSVRDLPNDWRLGIINIPSETLLGAGLTTDMPYEQVVARGEITSWLEAEVQEASANLRDVQQTLSSIREDFSVKVLHGLANSAMKV